MFLSSERAQQKLRKSSWVSLCDSSRIPPSSVSPSLPVPLPPPSTAMQELAGHLVSPQNSATQARSRLPKDHSLPGHSPSPAALAAMEGLISSAVRKGHLSPLYVQPLLVKGESCLSSQQNASLKEGKTLSLKRKIFFWQCCKAYEILVP